MSERVEQTLERRLALFAVSMFECSWGGMHADGADIQEEGVRLGLLTQTTFDPATHHDPTGSSAPGDTYYVVTDELQRALDGTGSTPTNVPVNDTQGEP